MNTNCLAGLRCLECGNEDALRVVVECWADLRDEGAEVDVGDDLDWTEESRASCPRCGFGADGWVTVKDFRL